MSTSPEIGPRGLPIAFCIGPLRIEPALVLAPMEGVTDLAFRRLIRALGPVGMTWTEFVPGPGISRGEERWMRMAAFDPDERPIVVQLYGREPAILAEAAARLQDQGCSAIDINMGCPSRKVCAHSGGSALMREPDRVRRIVAAVRAAISLPLLVKMRAGYDHQQRNAPEIAWIAQEEGADAVTVHWRTRADLFGGERRLDAIAAVVQRVSLPVIGNGDIVDGQSAAQTFRETGCHGLMIGRGAMKNPWIFAQIAAELRGEPVPAIDAGARRAALLRYIDACQDLFQGQARGDPSRTTLGRLKQLAKYFLDEPEGRRLLLRAESLDQAQALVRELLPAS